MPPEPALRTALIQHMLTTLETPSKPLTSWEEGFIASISEQFDSKGTLSDKQTDILERIYTDKTA